MVVLLAARGRTLGAMTFASAESGRKYSEPDLHFAEELARRCAVAIDNARLFISEQRARQNANVASRAKDEFLAVVSHELRTPLNAILGWAKMMSSPTFDEERRGRAVETIERNAVAMAQLIEDLLDMSRIISGKVRLDVQRMDIAPVVDAAIESVRPAADAKEIRVTSVFDPHLPEVVGDPTCIQQIVWNLLSNAVKFTPKSGSIDVSLRRSDAWAEISVADTGRGIAFRVLVPLSAVRRSSSPPPRASATESEARDAPACRRELDGLRVLVVDDEKDARQLVQMVLEDCG
jgi:signal transduction histidine kinase